MVLLFHSLLRLLSGTCSLIFAAGGVETIDDGEVQLVGRETVVLLNLIVAHVGILVLAITLQNVYHGNPQGERFFAEEALLYHEAQAAVVVVVVEVHIVTTRTEHEVDVESPVVLQAEGVEGIEGKYWLVIISPACTACYVDVFNVQIQVLLFETCRCIQRPESYAGSGREKGAETVDGTFQVDMLDECRIVVHEIGSLGDGVL